MPTKLTEMRNQVLSELSRIPEWPKPQQKELRMAYWLRRMNSLGKKARRKMSAYEVLQDCIAELKKQKKDYKHHVFSYDKWFFCLGEDHSAKKARIEAVLDRARAFVIKKRGNTVKCDELRDKVIECMDVVGEDPDATSWFHSLPVEEQQALLKRTVPDEVTWACH